MSGKSTSPEESTLSKLRSIENGAIGTLTFTFSLRLRNGSRDRGSIGFACFGEGSPAVMSSIFKCCTDAMKRAKRRGELTVERFVSW